MIYDDSRHPGNGRDELVGKDTAETLVRRGDDQGLGGEVSG